MWSERHDAVRIYGDAVMAKLVARCDTVDLKPVRKTTIPT